MTEVLWSIGAYSIQIAVLAAVAYAAVAVVQVRVPRMALRFWQIILLAAVLLPILQPAPTDTNPSLFRSTASSTISSSSREAFFATVSDQAVSTIIVVLAIGVVLRFFWLGIGLWRVRSLVANARPDASLTLALTDLQRDLGTTTAILITDELEGPATIGARRPIVLLPRPVLDLAPAVQRAIVCHELMHVRRRDWLHTIGEEVFCATLWFHPAARLIASRLSLAREMVVDEATLSHTRDRRAYAEALLAFANPQPHVIGVTPLIGRHTLSQRISQIAEEGSMSRLRAVASILFALAASVAVTAATADRFPISPSAQDATVYAPGDGVSLPRVLHEVKPGYTRAAMDAKIQGSVWINVVVGASGDVTNVDISRSLDAEFGLDAMATEAAYKWKFKPGTKNGKAVAVKVTIEMTFTLK